MPRIRSVIGISIALGAVTAGSADAASVTTTRQYWFKADPGELNNLTLTITADRESVVFVDEGASLEAREGCTGGGEPGEPATCRLEGVGPVPIGIDLADRSDRFDASSLPKRVTDAFQEELIVLGGTEADRIETGDTDDLIRPGKGDDVARAGLGSDDFLIEENGNDGDDTYDGGGTSPRPSDQLSYFRADAPVRVTLDGGGPDGRPGENDDLRSIELLEGTKKDDVLTGSGPGQSISGLEGDDVIRGAGGNDNLDGAEGDDLVVGGAGPDDLEGEQGDDRLLGRDGRDDIVGGRGRDTLKGGEEQDRLNGIRTNLSIARDEASDRLQCGPGRDFAAFEPQFDSLSSCERTRRGA